MKTQQSGLILKIAQGSITEIAKNTIAIEGGDIKAIAKKIVNENAEQGIFFR